MKSYRDKGGRVLPGKKWRVFNFAVEVAVESPKGVDEEEAAEDANDFAVGIFKGRMARVESSFCSVTNIKELDVKANSPFLAGMMMCNGSFLMDGHTPKFSTKFFDDASLEFVMESLKNRKIKFKVLKQNRFQLEVKDLDSVRKLIGLIFPYLSGAKKKEAELLHEFTELRKRAKDDKLSERELFLIDLLSGKPKKSKPKPKKVRY